MSGMNLNTHSNLGSRKNSVNPYQNTKLDKYISSYNKMTSNTKAAITDLIANKKNKNDSNPLKAREEGFNVYIMGANEERVKNVRKNEQLEKNSKNRVSNSRSAARKNWNANNLIYAGAISQNPKNNFIEKKESRSISRHIYPKSAGKEFKAIFENTSTQNNYSSEYVKKSIQNNKVIPRTKESIADIQSMLNNINNMNKNLAHNLKRLNVLESPKTADGEHSKRFRIFEDQNFSIAYPNLTSSIDNLDEENKDRKAYNNIDIMSSKNLNLDAEVLDDDILELNEKISSDIKNLDYEFDNIDHTVSFKESLTSNQMLSDKLPSKVSSILNNKLSVSGINCSNTNISLNPVITNNNILKASNISLKKSKNTLDNANSPSVDYRNEFRKSSICNKENLKQESTSSIIHHFINKELNIKLNNESMAMKNIWNNKTLNTTNELSKNNRRESFLINRNVDKAHDNTDSYTRILSKVSSSLSPKKQILSALNKTRAKSSNKTKQAHQERPYSTIMHLLKPKQIPKKQAPTDNRSQLENKGSMPGNNLHHRNNYNSVSKEDNKGNKINLIPSIQFIYKSPQNKLFNQAPVTGLKKAQHSIRTSSIEKQQARGIVNTLNTEKLITTRDYLTSINCKDRTEYLSNKSVKNISLENSKFHFKHLSTSNMSIMNNVHATNNNVRKNSKILQHFTPVLNSNNQQINKLPNLSNNDSSSNSNSNSNYQGMGSYSNVQSKRKSEILSKIQQLDEKKFHKLAQVVEELANRSGELSHLSLNDSKHFKDSSSKNMHNVIFRNMTEKYNINYINADSVNFGNININLNKNNKKNQEKICSERERSDFNCLTKEKNIKTFEEFINEEYTSPKFENENEINFNDSKESNSEVVFSPLKLNSKNHKLNLDENLNNLISSNTYQNMNNTPTGNMFRNSIKSFLNHSLKSSNTICPNFSSISFTIYSNWGSRDKIGLTEIQLFDKRSKQIEIVECRVKHGSDEGISNIYNSKYNTKEESNMWVSPINQKNENIIIRIFHQSSHLVDSIVIWNYNAKDLAKGVKEVKIEIDTSKERDKIVWSGIIRKGSDKNKLDYSTKIKLIEFSPKINENDLFSKSSKSDKNLCIPTESFEKDEVKYEMTNPFDSLEISGRFERKTNSKTINDGLRDSLGISQSKMAEIKNENSKSVFRNSLNLQSLNPSYNNLASNNEASNTQNSARSNNIGNINSKITNLNENNDCSVLRASVGEKGLKHIKEINKLITKPGGIMCNRIKIILSSNYGDREYVGLTGLKFLDTENKSINIEEAKSIGALPKDINTVFDNCGDPRIFENVFNQINEMTDDTCMWLTPFNPYTPPFLELEFESAICLSSILIWNYNKPNQLERGARTIEIIIDEDYSNGKTVILRKGIGEDDVDFSQIIYYPFNYSKYTDEDLELFQSVKPASLSYLQDYETPYLPIGFIYKLVLHSSWGDADEIGLSNVEFFDQKGNSFFTNKNYSNLKVIAIPCYKDRKNSNSITANYNITSMNNSIAQRKDNSGNKWIFPLINNRIVACEEDGHITSRPLDDTFSNPNNYAKNYNANKNNPNCVYFLFDRPVCVSFIQFSNLSDTPSKGCKDFDIYCDDNLIYKGTLKKASDGIHPSTVILFTSNEKITKNIDKRLLNMNTKHKYKFINREENKCYIMTREEEIDSDKTQNF